MWSEIMTDFTLGGLELPASKAKDLVEEAVTAIQGGNAYDKALMALNTAIEKHQEDLGDNAFLLFDLRAACYLHCKQYDKALCDGDHCIKLKESWPRGWARRGAALLCQGSYEEALDAYNQAYGWSLGSADIEIVRGRQMAQKAVEDYAGAKQH